VRFPSLFIPGTGSSIWLIRDAATVAACVIVKRRMYATGNDVLPFAMIGGVCTDAAMRGRGLASELLRRAEEAELQNGVNSLVLWTTIGPFYERLGWQTEDNGIFGTVRGFGGVHEVPTGVVVVSPSEVADRLEIIRQRWLVERVLRIKDDYSSIPFPAGSAECILAGTDIEEEAYCLVGRKGSTGYVYEVVGSPRGFASVWSAIRRRYHVVYVNDSHASPTARWLNENLNVDWQTKSLAMWRGESRFYVPYFDRI